MNEFQTRLELQRALQQTVDSFMRQYNIPATMMDDALSKVLLNIREQSLTEFLYSLQQQASSNRQEIKEEDDNGGGTE